MSIAVGRAHWQQPAETPPVESRQHDGHTPISLRVLDLATSQRFYSELLGFVPAQGYGFSDSRVVLVSPLLANGFRSIILTRRDDVTNASGFILELETASELLDRYLLARLLHAPTTTLIQRGRTLTTCIQDPDGHRIELRAGSAQSRGEESRWDRHPAEPDRPSCDGERSWDR